VLARPVFGATLVKELSVAAGHPFVYQRHVYIGGQGRVSFANHANVSLTGGGIIRTSAKAMWETPPTLRKGPGDGAVGADLSRAVGRSDAFPGASGTGRSDPLSVEPEA
jgi:hypothetical protein